MRTIETRSAVDFSLLLRKTRLELLSRVLPLLSSPGEACNATDVFLLRLRGSFRELLFVLLAMSGAVESFSASSFRLPIAGVCAEEEETAAGLLSPPSAPPPESAVVVVPEEEALLTDACGHSKEREAPLLMLLSLLPAVSSASTANEVSALHLLELELEVLKTTLLPLPPPPLPNPLSISPAVEVRVAFLPWPLAKPLGDCRKEGK